MSFKVHIVEKLCCGSTAYVVELEKPIRKNHVPAFINAGYLVPEHYTNLGLFYSKKDGLIATCCFDRTSINVRCSGDSVGQNNVNQFAEIADNIINKEK